MKRNLIFAALVAASVLAACTKEDTAKSVQSDKIVKTVTLTGTFEQNTQPQGKATLGPVSEGKMPLLWNVGDQIKGYINTKALTYANSVIADYNDSQSAKFTVHFTESEVPDEDDKMLFFYPGQKGDLNITAAGVSFTFPEYQFAVMGGLPTDSQGGTRKLAAAVADAGKAVDVYNGNVNSLKFQNVFAIVQFSFDESLANVKEFALVGNDNEVLTGTYNIAADASIALDGTKTSYKAASLKYNTDVNFATGSKYFVVLAPSDFKKGFTVKLTLDNGVVMTKSSPEKLYSFPRSSVNGLGVLKAGDFVAQWEPTVTEKLSLVSNTVARNSARDAEYVYAPPSGSNPAVISAYPLDGGETKTLSNTGITGGTHLVSAVNVFDGSIIVSNLAIGNADGTAKLKVYKWDSVGSDPVQMLSYTLANGVRLGDKFTAYGDWNDGILIFNDYSKKNAAYVFTVRTGEVNSNPVVVNYSAAYGHNLAAIYKYSESQYIWAGVASGATQGGQNVRLFNYGTSLTDASSSTALPFVSGTNKSAGSHGLRFFEMYGNSFMAYLQVTDKSNSYLNICRIGSETSFADALSSATSIYSAKFGTPGNEGIYGDAAVYADGSVTYVAALAYGKGITVYEIK